MYQFPSPHGDKFQQDHMSKFYIRSGFRPLTGINFNRREVTHKDNP